MSVPQTGMVGATPTSATATYFVNLSAGDFHNAGGSPALGQGVPLAAPYTVDKTV